MPKADAKASRTMRPPPGWNNIGSADALFAQQEASAFDLRHFNLIRRSKPCGQGFLETRGRIVPEPLPAEWKDCNLVSSSIWRPSLSKAHQELRLSTWKTK